MLIIHREGDPKKERSVRITDGGRGSWRIDPQFEILEATGVCLNRHGCIMSFAEGIRQTGQTVLRQNHSRFNMCAKGIYELDEKKSVGLEYFLVGFAWAKGDWTALKQQLQMVMPGYRLTMLKSTASYYYEASFCSFGKLKLQFP